ncbi:hypothetical protein AB685_19495 [Bacillus sp. LL01]|nr:hypothetical protein AB685_19495 [Bacillus sp. LL01]
MFYILAIIFLASTFFISSVSKLNSRESFYKTLHTLGFHAKYNSFIFYMIVLSEMLISIFIIFSVSRMYAHLLIYLLLIIFIYVFYLVRKSGRDVNCNCFGDLTEERIGKFTLIKIGILFILNTSVWLYSVDATITSYPITIVIEMFSIATGIWLLYFLLISYRKVSIKG